MNDNYIDHIDDKGVVTAVDMAARTITVRVLTDGDCGGCPAAKLCGVASADDKLTTLRVDSPSRFRTGMKVLLRGSERMHRRAIMLATVLPCICLIAIMVAVYLLTADQLAAALCGAGAMVLFYLVLWLMRDKVAHEFEFEAIPVE